MSTRETALNALLACLVAGCPGADVKRNASVPEDLGPGGLVILRDGEPGEPEVTLSPPAYAYEHRAVVEVLAGGATQAARDALFDALLVDIGAALLASPHLGGAVDHAEPDAPEGEALPSEEGAALKAGRLFVTLVYVTSSPLG